MNTNKLIAHVEKESIASKYGVCAGDTLLSVNGKDIRDVFDYKYLVQDTKITISLLKADGKTLDITIEKDENEDIGLAFDTWLMDRAKGCANKCIFCFIDQLPTDMRTSLYFKDDDPRLSFLHGNYVTLTNISDDELKRLAFYHLSPINISVHTTDPKLRVFMLKNPKAADLFSQIEILKDSNISMNFQVVLCRGINDGKHLDKTICDLSSLYPYANSLSIVPAGLTSHRDNLFSLENFTAEDSVNVIKQIEKWQEQFLPTLSNRFVYASDEFYIKARQMIPSYGDYDDFPQLENGVGKLALLEHEFMSALRRAWRKNKKDSNIQKNLYARPKSSVAVIATGVAAYPFISNLVDKFKNFYKKRFCHFPETDIKVMEVKNDFFGNEITVSGLLTGADILKTATAYKPCVLLIPSCALRSGDTVFLDDMNISDLQYNLGAQVIPVADNGRDFVSALIKLCD